MELPLHRTLWISAQQSKQLQRVVLAALVIVPTMYMVLHDALSPLTVILVALTLTATWLLNIRAAIVLTFFFLFLLGDLRRIVAMYARVPALDPLLMIAPVLATFAAVPLLLRTKFTDPFAKVVLALTVLMLLEIFNPRQGPFPVGLSGALFFLTPVFCFWIGRRYADEGLFRTIIYNVLIPVGMLATLLGIYQTFVGFLPWEKLWIAKALESGYTALGLGNGHIRSFGFSPNSVEYGNLLLITGVCLIAAVFSGKRAYGLLLPFVLAAQLLASQRSQILRLLLALAMLWAVRGRDPRLWIPRLLVGLPLGLGLLFYSVSHTGSEDLGKSATTADYATRHVTAGFAHPLDSRYSTAGLHTQMFVGGITDGLVNPLGFGLGVSTLGASKFGSESAGVYGSSEVDISDVFRTNGFIGGLLYLSVIFLGFKAAFRYVRNGPRSLSYPLLGILTCMMGAWIPLGQYALGPLIWFGLGFLARRDVEDLQ